jgi:Flp pilus assembly secretin CpaC
MGISKSVVVEVSRDIKDIVIADRTIASAFTLSKRKVEIIWPAPGFGDTELGVFMEREVSHGETKVCAGFQG